MVTGKFVELRPQEDKLVPVKRNGQLEGISTVAQAEREKVDRFIETLKKESRYLKRMKERYWVKEICERAERIRNDFVQFLEKHGIEPPSGWNEELVWNRNGQPS